VRAERGAAYAAAYAAGGPDGAYVARDVWVAAHYAERSAAYAARDVENSTFDAEHEAQAKLLTALLRESEGGKK
jgi:hypothetical protein